MNIALLLAVLLAVAFYFAKRRFDALTSRQKKNLWTRKVNRLFWWLEDRGLMGRTPAFDRDYEREYHGLRALEVAHPVVKAECLKLLEHKDQLTDVKDLGAGLTKGGIHKAQWKAFMFKSGEFIEENCALAPRTAELIRKIPNVYTAFFSIVDPQRVASDIKSIRWPGDCGRRMRLIAESPKGVTISCQNATALARKYGCTESDLRAVLERIPEVRL